MTRYASGSDPLAAAPRSMPGVRHAVHSVVAAEHTSEYGPRLTRFVGELVGIVGASRSAVQDLCASVCGIALSQGAMPHMVDRVSVAIGLHYTAIGAVARTSFVNSMDETSWLLHGTRPWRWGMANPAVASFLIYPDRSKAASLLLDSGVLCSNVIQAS